MTLPSIVYVYTTHTHTYQFDTHIYSNFLSPVIVFVVGTSTFANMLKDDDLQVIFLTLKNLRSLKLYWSHLINEDVWGVVRSETLHSLCLWNVKYSLPMIAEAFPNLAELKMGFIEEQSEIRCLSSMKQLKYVKYDVVFLCFYNLTNYCAVFRKLFIGEIRTRDFKIDDWKDLRLTHLWLYVFPFTNLRPLCLLLNQTLIKLVFPCGMSLTMKDRLGITEGTNVTLIDLEDLIDLKVQGQVALHLSLGFPWAKV
jgi:hypothetical protein